VRPNRLVIQSVCAKQRKNTGWLLGFSRDYVTNFIACVQPWGVMPWAGA
jgi:hypothetical protein